MNKKNIKIENLFLIISIVLGMILVFIVPPFQSPDEDTHFLKSYLISEGKFYQKQNGEEIGFDIPKNLNDYIQEKQKFMGDLNKKYTYEEQYYDQLLSFSYEEEIFRNISTGQTSVVAHIVPAIGVKFGSFMKAFNDGNEVGPAVLLQYARMASLIVYSIVGYFAIKMTPKFKKTFFTILLLPSSLFLRSMVTYDSLILVVTALSIAKMLQMFYDDKYSFKRKDMLLFIICGYILLNVKTVYAFVFLLMFAIPNKKFGGMKEKIKSFVIIISLVLLLTLLLKIPNILLDIPTNNLISEQIQYVLHNPIQFIKIIFSNIFSQMHVQIYWMVGTYGLLDTYIPVLLLSIIYINLFFILVYEIITEELEIPIWVSILYILFTTLSIIAIYSSMYINWVPEVLGEVGGSVITGVQGRYYLPYLFIIPLMFSNKLIIKITKRINNFLENYKEKITTIYYLIPITCLILSVFIIFERYWI